MTAIVCQGDARHLQLPDESVDLVVTSPPYFSLRDYSDGGASLDGQLGAEPTPAEYLDALIECTAEWMRVLKPGGSIFLNMGDKYASYEGNRGRGGSASRRVDPGRNVAPRGAGLTGGGFARNKSLFGLPWRYAIRCIDELGLILRAEIVWAKPNGLPESVTDRVRRSHEQVFHFTKQPRYYSAVDAIREPHVGGHSGKAATFKRDNPSHTLIPGQAATQQRTDRPDVAAEHMLGKLPGSVWTIATTPLKVPAELGIKHFAAYPPELVRRIILGWSPREVCTACGEGRRPVAASVGLDMDRPQARRAHELATEAGLTEAHFGALLSVGVSDTGRGKATQSGTGKNTPEVYALAEEAREVLGGYAREYLLRRPTSFRDACACPDANAPSTPGVVLDPFGGTGTTALVASVHGRVGITVDLSSDYCRLAQWRTTDEKQRAKAAGTPAKKAPKKTGEKPVKAAKKAAKKAPVIPLGQLHLIEPEEESA